MMEILTLDKSTYERSFETKQRQLVFLQPYYCFSLLCFYGRISNLLYLRKKQIRSREMTKAWRWKCWWFEKNAQQLANFKRLLNDSVTRNQFI